MKFEATPLQDVYLLEPKVFGDPRGFFLESWNAATFREAGFDINFVQDNQSRSAQGILRGMHYQTEHTQGKLVRVTAGEVYDVVVDLRRNSDTFGQWYGATLSAENHRMLWVPAGFAHGFYVLSHEAEFTYKCTDYYAPEHERCILWNDPVLDIDWPILEGVETIISEKDSAGVQFTEAEIYE